MRKLSKSKKEFIDNSGWSSLKFFNKALKIIDWLEKDGHIVQFGRTVIHIDGKLKVYCHKNTSNDYITFTNFQGEELKTFHYSESTNTIYTFIVDYMKGLE